MPATVICGLQWGDEGKGKVTDMLAGDVSLVVRYQGGDNAGHTVVLGDETFKLHLVPSGVLHPHIQPIIGSGVVVNPRVLLDEIDMLEGRGISTAKVRVSSAAHVIMPYHLALDEAREAGAQGAIGTTKRGVGPAYADRAARVGRARRRPARRAAAQVAPGDGAGREERAAGARLRPAGNAARGALCVTPWAGASGCGR